MREGGVAFAVFSLHATSIELCLFDRDGIETARVPMRAGANGIWSVQVPGLRAGQRYGLRADGPRRPEAGHHFDPTRVLLDPYARALCAVGRHPPSAPLGVVVDPTWDWTGDRRPAVPWRDTVLCEAHVKGMTALHPDLPPHLRGTYLGLCSEPVVAHLRSLGITALELMPVQYCASEPFLVASGLTNYWGYNPLGLFAPDARFACGAGRAGGAGGAGGVGGAAGAGGAGGDLRGDSGAPVAEFKAMVAGLHRAGLEVILDVVFNHTAEGSLRGPTWSWRGLDNATYYRHRQDDPGAYDDVTGCGNTLNVEHPRVLQMVLDCLRYWVEEMRVDGFRFDLATALAREGGAFAANGAFLTAVREAPYLRGIKLIAEPWDLGEGGYRLGGFPAEWAEWNGRFRDCVRRLWRGDRGQLPELAARLAGSRDLFGTEAPRRYAAINYVACHDGFPLADVVRYEHKHNADNPPHHQGGTDANFSSGWGAEGDTDDPAILAARERVRRGLLATWAFARGTPMLLGGDELGRSQGGNNNAYCHDDARSWTHWDLDDAGRDFLAYARRLLALRRSERGMLESEVISWLRPDGGAMEVADWEDAGRACFGMRIDAPAAAAGPGQGEGDRAKAGEGRGAWLLLINAGGAEVGFALPEPVAGWRQLLHSAEAAERLRPGPGARGDGASAGATPTGAVEETVREGDPGEGWPRRPALRANKAGEAARGEEARSREASSEAALGGEASSEAALDEPALDEAALDEAASDRAFDYRSAAAPIGPDGRFRLAARAVVLLRLDPEP